RTTQRNGRNTRNRHRERLAVREEPMILRGREHLTPAVSCHQTKAAGRRLVLLDLDGTDYLLTPTEAHDLADQLHDTAERCTP
ncbi:MAG: hypothetical protein Q4G67_12225, partial [Actinomycetia bacterium]|nr:hypothetical protein [Actinomycetes bacterium]